MESNAASAQERLLKTAGADYGTSQGSSYAQMNTSSVPAPSPALETGLHRHRTLRGLIHAPAEEKAMRFKQLVASFAIVLSAGGKIAHEVIRAWHHEGNHEWFKPVPGMTLIYWVAVYGLQMDYVFMLGHTPTMRDPVGYGIIRNIASANVHKFFFSHLFLFLWQLFLILNLPILALTSVTLAFFTLCIMYAKIHGKSREIDIPRANGLGGSNTVMSPSFIQGPISALFVFVALIHMPSTLIIVITKYHPNANLDAIEWPLAWWILIVNLIGAHVATRRKIFNKKATQQLNALQIQVAANNNGQAPPSPPQQEERTVPVDLAAVIGLFWGTLAVAAGTGSVNWGPVMVIGYIGAIWQGIALFGALTD